MSEEYGQQAFSCYGPSRLPRGSQAVTYIYKRYSLDKGGGTKEANKKSGEILKQTRNIY